MNPFRLYAVCASFYGSARASFRVPDSDMLPGTKLLTISLCGLYAPILMPIYVVNDLNRASIFSNGLKYSDYGYPDKDTSVADVLFH
jgi:hypothetical protein